MRGGHQIVYISGPITGVLQSTLTFSKAERWLFDQGHSVMNPMGIEDPKDPLKDDDLWVYYMKKQIKHMLDGWEKSKGARLEFWIATELNIPVHYAHEDHKYV